MLVWNPTAARSFLCCAAVSAGIVACPIDGRNFESPVDAFERGLHFPSNAVTVDGALPAGVDTGPHLLPPDGAASLVVAPGGTLAFIVRWDGGAINGVNLHCGESYNQVPIRPTEQTGPTRVEISARLDTDVCDQLPSRCHRIEYDEQLMISEGRFSSPRGRALFLDCAGNGCAEGAEPAIDDGAVPASADAVATVETAPSEVIQEGADPVLPADCSPGDTLCSSDHEYRICSPQGTWSNAIECSGQACVGKQCTGVCEPEQTRCSGSNVQTCSSRGDWGALSACPTGSTCMGASCTGECDAGDQRCLDTDEAQTCSGLGQWQVRRCDYVCDDSIGDCAGECVPGRRECANATPRSCDSEGRWRNEASCDNGCSLGQCSGECESNETRCDPDSERGRQSCIEGSWNATSSCDFACRDDVSANGQSVAICFGECTAGQRSCTSATAGRACNIDLAYDDFTCPFACSLGQCTGECRPGAFRCGPDGINERCDGSGFWQDQAPCPSGQVCFGVLGMCTAVAN